MTKHAEVVSGVRALMADMRTRADRIRALFPLSIAIAQKRATELWTEGRYGAAADTARTVIAALREHELSDAETVALQAAVMDVAAATRMAREDLAARAGEEGIDAAALAEELATRDNLVQILDVLADKLNSAAAVYIAPGSEPLMKLEKTK